MFRPGFWQPDFLYHPVTLTVIFLVAGTFLFSGFSKIKNPQVLVTAAKRLGAPESAAKFAVMVPMLEILLAVGLLLAPGRWFKIPAIGLLLLLFVFTGLLIHALRLPEKPSCGCFGESEQPISSWDLWRNLWLIGAIVWLLFKVPRINLWKQLYFATPGQLGAVLLLLAGFGMGLVIWQKINQLAQALQSLPPAVSTIAADLAPNLGLANQQPAVLISPNGEKIILDDIATHGAQFLVFLSGGCGSCVDFAPRAVELIGTLEPDVAVKVVAVGEAEIVQAAYADKLSLMHTDPTGAVRDKLGVHASPGAVLIGTNGQVAAGPAAGAAQILELYQVLLEAVQFNQSKPTNPEA